MEGSRLPSSTGLGYRTTAFPPTLSFFYYLKQSSFFYVLRFDASRLNAGSFAFAGFRPCRASAVTLFFLFKLSVFRRSARLFWKSETSFLFSLTKPAPPFPSLIITDENSSSFSDVPPSFSPVDFPPIRLLLIHIEFRYRSAIPPLTRQVDMSFLFPQFPLVTSTLVLSHPFLS